uniref:RxLR effector protein n=1 Tax=Phytophthora agathidicida TaxID=1642459 RepID=A0A7G4WI24_9STRA|nr:PaRXLR35 [Phytophthora agathidicida]
MRLHDVLLLTVTALTASCEALTPADQAQLSTAERSGLNSNTGKRSLRRHETLDDDDDNEERAGELKAAFSKVINSATTSASTLSTKYQNALKGAKESRTYLARYAKGLDADDVAKRLKIPYVKGIGWNQVQGRRGVRQVLGRDGVHQTAAARSALNWTVVYAGLYQQISLPLQRCLFCLIS